MTANELEAAVTDKTKAIIINSPSNPTGAVYSKDELYALAEVVLRHNLIVISDDIYEKILYDGFPFWNMAAVNPSVKDLTVVVNGVSKAYAMTGWRIGYAAGPEPLIAAIGKIQSQSTSNPTSISQKAAVEALTGDQGLFPQWWRSSRKEGITSFPLLTLLTVFPVFVPKERSTFFRMFLCFMD
jgi:aspartate aminotransferase